MAKEIALAGKTPERTAVTFPQRSSDAQEAMYVLAHELVGSLVAIAFETT